MHILHAENRDAKEKGNSLRREGLIPGCVFGGSLEETLLIRIPEREARSMLKEVRRGGRVTLNVDGNSIETLLKGFSCSPVGEQIEHLSFQLL